MEFNLLDKIDFKVLLNILIGSDSLAFNQDKEIHNILSEEYEKSIKFNKHSTYENFFYRICPNLNFKNIERYTYEYVKKIEKEIKQVDILNVNKK